MTQYNGSDHATMTLSAIISCGLALLDWDTPVRGPRNFVWPVVVLHLSFAFLAKLTRAHLDASGYVWMAERKRTLSIRIAHFP